MAARRGRRQHRREIKLLEWARSRGRLCDVRVGGKKEAQNRVEFVDRAIGGNAQVILGNPLPIPEGCLSLIPGSGIDTRQVYHDGDPGRKALTEPARATVRAPTPRGACEARHGDVAEPIGSSVRASPARAGGVASPPETVRYPARQITRRGLLSGTLVAGAGGVHAAGSGLPARRAGGNTLSRSPLSGSAPTGPGLERTGFTSSSFSNGQKIADCQLLSAPIFQPGWTRPRPAVMGLLLRDFSVVGPGLRG